MRQSSDSATPLQVVSAAKLSPSNWAAPGMSVRQAYAAVHFLLAQDSGVAVTFGRGRRRFGGTGSGSSERPADTG